MPSLQDVPGVVKCTLKYTQGNDLDVVNSFFMSYGGTDPTLTELDTFAGTVATQYGTHLKSLAPNAVTSTEVICTALYSHSGPESAVPNSISGTRGSTYLGAAVCAIFQFKVARRFRGGHYRMYAPFGIETDLGTGINEWDSSFISACETGWDAFITAISTTPWTGSGSMAQCGVSYYEGFTNHTYPNNRVRAIPNPRTPPLVDPIDVVTLNPKLGSQRRRNLQSA